MKERRSFLMRVNKGEGWAWGGDAVKETSERPAQRRSWWRRLRLTRLELPPPNNCLVKFCPHQPCLHLARIFQGCYCVTSYKFYLSVVLVLS